MQIEDIQALFSYLRVLHPNCPSDKVPKLTRTRAQEWIAAAEGYSRDQLFQAGRAHAQSCRFWPDLSEILARLPPLAQGEKLRYAPPGPLEAESMARLRAWQEEWHRELEALGLFGLRETAARGMSPREWNVLLREAGVWEADHG